VLPGRLAKKQTARASDIYEFSLVR